MTHPPIVQMERLKRNELLFLLCHIFCITVNLTDAILELKCKPNTLNHLILHCMLHLAKPFQRNKSISLEWWLLVWLLCSNKVHPCPHALVDQRCTVWCSGLVGRRKGLWRILFYQLKKHSACIPKDLTLLTSKRESSFVRNGKRKLNLVFAHVSTMCIFRNTGNYSPSDSTDESSENAEALVCKLLVCETFLTTLLVM